ncbi:carboxypeptidase-like regulatory domain-containing protein [Streptomyces sp. MMG1121]|uniref:carboxypeptidase-like regulatory domain-containing protein n=1 Tax=Streptomyces sp. MMG1121 TaxID=1415544 RepID=UPI0006AE3352|nr:carboxypeptidase-like regulatory domain-containing protein [Streptomyces sp. MMG1121]KOV58156.1 hypothetical protein ADK64_37350 [Streptomyces sp. MMG1121]
MSPVAVAVEDVNGLPVPGATVVLDAASALTGTDGTAAFDLDPAAGRTITVSQPFYVTERAEFRDGGLARGRWNNALLRRQTAGATLRLTVRLGRWAGAPTVLLTEEQLAAMALAGGDPHGALLMKLPSDPSRLAYRQQWNAPLPVELAQPVLLPERPPAHGTTGWRRFNSTPATPPADIAALGRFFFVTCPGDTAAPKDPTYAAAVWSPNLNLTAPPDTLDLIVFFSPHTLGWTPPYPFGVSKGVPGADQAFVMIGTRYLTADYAFAYNLIARRRQAIVVMPLCRKGDWGPFACADGLFRLCREVLHFLHRECRTSTAGLTTVGGIDRVHWLAGASLRAPGAGVWADGFGLPPSPGRIVVSGFSTGIAPVKQVLGGGPLTGFDRGQWGCPDAASRDAFAAAWQEIWDLDGFHPATGGWPNYLNLLNGWYHPGGPRELRLIHSSGRVPPDAGTSDHPLFKRLRAEGVTVDRRVPTTPGIGGARELHGRAWSAVALDDPYIGNDPPVGTPALGDAHHATPKVGFSHCAALSRVGATPGP